MTIEMADLPGRAEELLAMIEAGQEVVLTVGGAPKAKMVPIPQPGHRPPRKLGLAEGRPGYWMAPDFDDPLPDEFWLGGSP